MRKQVLELGGGLCGLDQYSFPPAKFCNPLLYQEHSHLVLAAYKALLGAECRTNFADLDFSGYMHVRRYSDLGMIRGEYHLALFSGEFARKNGGDGFIYVVMQTEAKQGKRLQAQLFARSLPVAHYHPDVWMNHPEVWDFVDTSLIHPVTVMSTR